MALPILRYRKGLKVAQKANEGPLRGLVGVSYGAARHIEQIPSLIRSLGVLCVRFRQTFLNLSPPELSGKVSGMSANRFLAPPGSGKVSGTGEPYGKFSSGSGET